MISVGMGVGVSIIVGEIVRTALGVGDVAGDWRAVMDAVIAADVGVTVDIAGGLASSLHPTRN